MKTRDRSKHNLFDQVVIEMKDEMVPYNKECKLKDTAMANLGFTLYTGGSGHQIAEVEEPECIKRLFDSSLTTVTNINTVNLNLLIKDIKELIRPLMVVVWAHEWENGIWLKIFMCIL